MLAEGHWHVFFAISTWVNGSGSLTRWHHYNTLISLSIPGVFLCAIQHYFNFGTLQQTTYIFSELPVREMWTNSDQILEQFLTLATEQSRSPLTQLIIQVSTPDNKFRFSCDNSKIFYTNLFSKNLR